MVLKIFGAIMVLISCGGVGFKMASNYRKDEKALEQLVNILNFMHCQLQYQLTPLPSLCRQVAADFRNIPGNLFAALASEMESQASPNIGQCMMSVLRKSKAVPEKTREQLIRLGNSLGRFDLDGQLKGLEATRNDCARVLEEMRSNRDVRLRSYQTLGLCAGAALAILFI